MWSRTAGPAACFVLGSMKLYAYRYCPYSRRVRIALAEHSVEFDYVEQAPDAPYPAEIRDKVPGESGVPVLFVRDDFVLWDSTAIVHWLDSSHPRSLYPSQRDPQALARAWQGWAAKLYPHIKELHEGNDAEKSKAEKEIIDALRGLEKMIKAQWLVDGEFSVADIALAPVLAELSSKAIATLPKNVREYVGRVRARPSVREVCELDLPDEQRPSFAA
jgi:glutathione S-transferase